MGDRGQKSKLKAGQAGDQKDKPPCEYHSGKVNRQRRGQTSRRARGLPPFPVPRGFSPGDARGCAPCIKITLVSPFPAGEGGWGISFPFGEGGQKSKLKAGQAGDKKGKPPAGCVVRPLPQCRAGSAPGMQGAEPLA